MFSSKKNQSNSYVFFSTQNQPCSYLDGETASFICLDPNYQFNQYDATLLSQHGFRRNGEILYRPRCNSCNQCQSVRLVVDDFSLSRTHKRLLKLNSHFTVALEDRSEISSQHYRLFRHYMLDRHQQTLSESDAIFQLNDTLGKEPSSASVLSAYDNGELIACMLCDNLLDGTSAVYTFYCSNKTKIHSLGTFMILQVIAHTKRLFLPYVYLGYWVQNCQKMRYKTRFQPLEHWVDGQWQLYVKTNTSNT